MLKYAAAGAALVNTGPVSAGMADVQAPASLQPYNPNFPGMQPQAPARFPGMQFQAPANFPGMQPLAPANLRGM